MISKNMIRSWIGDDNMDTESFLDLLVEFANGEYSIDQFNDDVIAYHFNEETV